MVSGGVGTVWEKYTSIDKVMEQNEQLETENAELRQQMVDYDRIKAENEAYKALANIQKKEQQRHLCVRFCHRPRPAGRVWRFHAGQGAPQTVWR